MAQKNKNLINFLTLINDNWSIADLVGKRSIFKLYWLLVIMRHLPEIGAFHPFIRDISAFANCSNPRYSWVTYFNLSNICNFSQLGLSILSTHTLFALSNFVILSIFRHRLAPCYLFTVYVIISPYKCTSCTHHKHNSFVRLIVRTLSAPIYLSNSKRCFWPSCHSDMGGSRQIWGFPHRKNRFASNSNMICQPVRQTSLQTQTIQKAFKD